MEEYTIPRIGTIKLSKLTSREIQKLYKTCWKMCSYEKRRRKPWGPYGAG